MNEGERVMSPQQQQEAMAYQQAFLQNAVAQNMQIQQQLLVQNQALTQLLQGSASGPNSASMTTMMGTPMPSMMPQVVNPGASGAASSGIIHDSSQDSLPVQSPNLLRKKFIAK